MVIRDLTVVGHAGNVRSDRNAGEKRELAADDGNDLTGGVLHIIRDELAVRARIGQELLFVKRLDEIECLLGSEAVVAVRLALQGGQIIELRRIDGFRLPLERRNDGLLFLNRPLSSRQMKKEKLRHEGLVPVSKGSQAL